MLVNDLALLDFANTILEDWDMSISIDFGLIIKILSCLLFGHKYSAFEKHGKTRVYRKCKVCAEEQIYFFSPPAISFWNENFENYHKYYDLLEHPEYFALLKDK